MPANDSWIYQGRDEKGRFGSGTSPPSGSADTGSGSASNRGNNLLPRIQAVIYGAVGHLSPPERPQYSAHLDRSGVSQLSDSLEAWGRTASLDRDTFRDRYLGGIGSDAVVDHLRKAAEEAAKAMTPEQQRDAADELAAAYRLVGPDRWSRFIAGAQGQTAAVAATSNRHVLLAQATTLNTATDAVEGGNASVAPGRYATDNPRRWIGEHPIGTGECVSLVQQATGAPRAMEWRPGILVQGNANIRPGTAIATFDSSDRYDGHAAIYLGQDGHGIQVVDQWNIRDSHGRIIGQQPPSVRTLPFNDPQHSRINRGDSYRVVE